ncbi:hypothetical protein WKW80_26955 [Variovorax humicola]|uniref:Uncharacterized protein n=1 Tax=Variovorax humicola TaxID=1769758 RepID=A0ABU8W6L3_9BURK
MALLNFHASAEVTVMGFSSCGQWVKQRAVEQGTRERFVTLTMEMWLIGYLSGLSVGTDIEVLRGRESQSLLLWVDNYCKANPLDDTSIAGHALFNALKKLK